jgi:hypothetical protein
MRRRIAFNPMRYSEKRREDAHALLKLREMHQDGALELVCHGYRIIISYLLATVRGAGLFTSSCALTFWTCAACSLSWAVRTFILFRC